jgi:hypothetical protein
MLEPLEDRLAPAKLLMWIAAQDNANWMNANNWGDLNTGRVAAAPPAAGDALVFQPGLTVGGVTGTNFSATDPNNNAISNLTIASNYTKTITYSGSLGPNITGTMLFSGGKLATAGQASLTLTGNNITSDWTGGDLNIPLVVGQQQGSTVTATTLAIDGVNSLSLNANLGVFGNGGATGGTVNLTGAGLAAHGGVNITVFPGGTFNIQSDASIISQAGTGAEGSLFNNGTFEKTAGTGNSRVDLDFQNGGKFDINSGTVRLTSSKNEQISAVAQTTLKNDMSKLSVVGTNYLMLGGTLSGIGTIIGTVNNGDPAGVRGGAATVHPGLDTGSGTLNITGNYFQSNRNNGILSVNATGGQNPVGLLNVQGNVTLGGTFTETRSGSYTPPWGRW